MCCCKTGTQIVGSCYKYLLLNHGPFLVKWEKQCLWTYLKDNEKCQFHMEFCDSVMFLVKRLIAIPLPLFAQKKVLILFCDIQCSCFLSLTLPPSSIYLSVMSSVLVLVSRLVIVSDEFGDHACSVHHSMLCMSFRKLWPLKIDADSTMPKVLRMRGMITT